MIKNIEDVSCAFLHDLDLVCFSHLRWEFVYQRPQHLLSRFAKHTRVFFFEEPIFHDAQCKLHIENSTDNLFIVVPHLQHGLSEEEIIVKQKEMIDSLIDNMKINRYF